MKHAAADAKRYGRRHHGSFRGLSLRWFRGRVPEAHSGAAGYLVAAHPIGGGAGFKVTAQGEGTEDTFSIAHRPSDAAERTCTMGHGGAGRHGCQDVRKGHGHW